MTQSPTRALLLNINLSSRTREGSERLAEALMETGSGVRVRLVHWQDAGPRLMRSFRPHALILGPNGTPFARYPTRFLTFLRWLKRRRGATLGVCGGHQAIALAHGAHVAPVFGDSPATDSYDGMARIDGPQDVRLLGDPDPLLTGLPRELTVIARHVDEVKQVPDGFHLLGIGAPTHVQIMRANQAPIYGVQFHPEFSSPESPAWRLLHNFMTLASPGACFG